MSNIDMHIPVEVTLTLAEISLLRNLLAKRVEVVNYYSATDPARADRWDAAARRLSGLRDHLHDSAAAGLKASRAKPVSQARRTRAA